MINEKHNRGSDRIFSDNSAISTVVSAILLLGLLVSVAAFVSTYYVPSWVADDEARHAQDVFVEFSAIPGHIDELVLANNTDAVARQRIELGCGGIPIVSPVMSWGSLGTVSQEGNFIVKADVWTENITKNATPPGNLTGECVNITNISSVSKFYIHIKDSYTGTVLINLSNQSGGLTLRIGDDCYNTTTWSSTGVKILDERIITTNPDSLHQVNILSQCYGFNKVLSDADIPYNITMRAEPPGSGSDIRYKIEYYEYNKTIEPFTKTSNGTMVYRSMNRYFIDQQFIYQNDAVFLCQPPDASMRTLPDIIIEDVGNYTHMMIPMITVGTGVNRTSMISGSGVEELQMGLKYVDRITFADYNNTESVSIIIEPPEGGEEFRKDYLQEWANYFNATVDGTSVRMPKPSYGLDNSSINITLTGKIHLEINEIEIEGRIASII